MKEEFSNVKNRFIPVEISIEKSNSADIITASCSKITDPNAGEWDFDGEA